MITGLYSHKDVDVCRSNLSVLIIVHTSYSIRLLRVIITWQWELVHVIIVICQDCASCPLYLAFSDGHFLNMISNFGLVRTVYGPIIVKPHN